MPGTTNKTFSRCGSTNVYWNCTRTTSIVLVEGQWIICFHQWHQQKIKEALHGTRLQQCERPFKPLTSLCRTFRMAQMGNCPKRTGFFSSYVYDTHDVHQWGQGEGESGAGAEEYPVPESNYNLCTELTTKQGQLRRGNSTLLRKCPRRFSVVVGQTRVRVWLVAALLHFSEFACSLRQGTAVRHCHQLALGLNEQGTGLYGNMGIGSDSSKVGGSYPCWG